MIVDGLKTFPKDRGAGRRKKAQLLLPYQIVSDGDGDVSFSSHHQHAVIKAGGHKKIQ